MVAKRVVASLGLCLPVAACGGSSKTHSSSSASQPSSTSSSATLPAGAPAGLAGVRGRVLARNEMKGYVPGRRALGTGAQAWVVVDQFPSGQRAARRLQRLRFIAGLREDLTGPGPNNLPGLSTVEQFGSAAAARSEIANAIGSAPRFPVSGIPGARGFGAAGSGYNVVFATGAYFYLVGAAAGPPGATGAPTPATVIAGAQHLYNRVKS